MTNMYQQIEIYAHGWAKKGAKRKAGEHSHREQQIARMREVVRIAIERGALELNDIGPRTLLALMRSKNCQSPETFQKYRQAMARLFKNAGLNDTRFSKKSCEKWARKILPEL